MFLSPEILQPITGITLPFVFKMTMMILHPDIIMITKHLTRIILERLPLGTLFPKSVTTIAIFITIAEACFFVICGTVQQFIAIHLILERVTDLMTDC